MRTPYGSYDEACGIGNEAIAIAIKYVRRLSIDAEVVVTEDCKLFQRSGGGDLIARFPGGFGSIEVKGERCNSPNLFLETWSNRSCLTRGWMDNCRADHLIYIFLDQVEAYLIPMPELRKWFFGSDAAAGRSYDFPEKRQGAYVQRNDTWGRCVPISVLKNEVPLFLGPLSPLSPDETDDLVRQRFARPEVSLPKKVNALDEMRRQAGIKPPGV